MKRLLNKKQIWAAFAFTAMAFCFACDADSTEKNGAKAQFEEIADALEIALYTRAEFFGAQAIVPFPTAQARENLISLTVKYPNERRIILKLSELNERLGDYEKAESELNNFVQLNAESPQSLEILADFYERRARFDRAVVTLERALKQTKGDERTRIFARIIALARRHKLENYLQPQFYREVIAKDLTTFAVVEQFITQLIAEQSYTEALEFVRNAREQFPERNEFLFDKEIEILRIAKREIEAETVYHQAFNPFWSGERAEAYYRFLDEQNRLRAYKNELRAKQKKKPADFDTALRLFHFEKNDYGDNPAKILLKLETARTERKIRWQADELLTAARLLIAVNEGAAASRFLYTLVAQNRLEKGSELRAKVLYQLFEILSDAESERLALANGNLDFYRDVAASDPHPGITTGILSLIFSDTNPASELNRKEQTATKLFNRAAAYHIFEVYKAENPASPELAQMYLDIVRLYMAEGETEIAAKTLAEFEARKEFEGSFNYPVIALKLADAFIAAKQYEKERAVYQKLLDFLGKKQFEKGQALVLVSGNAEPTQTKPALGEFPPKSNQGINVSDGKASANNYYNTQKYRDFIIAQSGQITYSEVLNRFVASLSREKRTGDILSLYAAETAKYPMEAGLYEQMLAWLGQTNLTEEQLKVYQTAIKKFPDAGWQDRLARWFLRNNRKAEFERFSVDLIEKFDDAETQKYLTEFINRNVAAKPETFDARLYLALYTRAHRRFPHNLAFVKGLLDYYRAHKLDAQWRQLTAEYYFAAPEIREMFLNELAKNGKLRDWQNQAHQKIEVATNKFDVLPYKLFRADASARLSNYEAAVDAYRELNRLYPNTPEYAERLITFTRSLSQLNAKYLDESAQYANAQAENAPAYSAYRTRAGEIEAERGDYGRAREQWQKLIETAKGEPETYLETATVLWDYFQYDDALKTIQSLRAEKRDAQLFAFESGAIYEAKKDLNAALAEYVKALDGSTFDAPNVAGSDRAKRRLAKLYERDGVPAQIETAFENERRKQTDAAKLSRLILGYADFLRRVENWDEGKRFLKAEVARNDNAEFLEEARDLCTSANDAETEIFVLQRLASTAKNARSNIKFNLQLAQILSVKKRNAEAAGVLKNLVAKFPTNYGVVSETADFYWHIGERENAIGVLQTAMTRARGRYRVNFGRKLAARFLAQKRDASAEAVLQQLYKENERDYGVVEELTEIYVRTGQREKLDAVFNQSLAKIKAQTINFREINEEVASFRQEMIRAFTRLEDYNAAIAQHIEIINREPENEEHTEAAINYVKRYGGAEKLLEYYGQTAQAAYKNYRWFVVLARIYEANKDYARATENYQIAIQNQPEMLELYDALANIYEKQSDFEAAISIVNKTLELSNDEPQRLRRLIALLEKSGRKAEAIAVRQKLPVEEKPRQTLAEQFAEAEQLKNTGKAKAREIYQTTIENLSAKPLRHELKTAEIVGYVNALRGAESLDKTANKLWNLRDKLVVESEKPNSTEAARARSQRSVLDAAIIEAIGGAARDFATGNERAAVFRDLAARIEKAAPGANDTLQLLQNLSRRAGFGLLEERILIKQKDAAFALKNAENYHSYLNALVAFYRECGDFQAVINLLEAERARDFAPQSFDYLLQIAENARLIGNLEKELSVLRESFQRKCKDCQTSENDNLTARYFASLTENGTAGRAELAGLTENLTSFSEAFQIQLINFLLEKGERELAHKAIENSGFSKIWKQSRHAQTVFALDESADEKADYFVSALQLKPIGELVGEKPQLAGDDWFKLANTYGKWLGRAKKDTADRFLPAPVEKRPQDISEQTKLGAWYLERRDAGRAIEHLNIALEKNASDVNALANLGAAHLLAGNESQALATWRRMIQNERADFQFYLTTLEKHGLAGKARETLSPILIRHLKGSDFEQDTKSEIRLLAKSFGDNKNADVAAAQSAFLLKIAASVEDGDLLPETVASESLVAKTQLAPFYELLIRNSAESDEVDYNYTELLKANVSAEEAETALDMQENYEPEEPAGERIKWQREYLNYLLKQRQTERAGKLISEIETSIESSYARPAWLRLAKLCLDLQNNRPAAEVLSDLKKFVGVNADAEKIIAPSLTRLNDAVDMLRAEKQETLADELQTVVYTRLLALGKFEKTTFVALSGIAFEQGNAALGLKLLQTMVDLTDDEIRETAAREIAEMDLIKASAVDRTKTGDVEAENTLKRGEALQLAAETAAKFEQTEVAIAFRRQLLSFAPNDAENRIEIAKLFARQQNFAEAANHLAAVMTNPEFTRKMRWRTLWTAAEVFSDRSETWNALKNQLADLQNKDAEMQNALAAVELWKTNRAGEAINLLKNSETITANLQFLAAFVGKENGQTEAAINGFLAAYKSDAKPEISLALSSIENEALRQIIALYVANGQPRAALKMAENKTDLNDANLLALLSNAAEQTGDFKRAAEFEASRKSLLTDAEQQLAAEKRIEFLNSRKRESVAATTFKVTRENVSE